MLDGGGKESDQWMDAEQMDQQWSKLEEGAAWAEPPESTSQARDPTPPPRPEAGSPVHAPLSVAPLPIHRLSLVCHCSCTAFPCGSVVPTAPGQKTGSLFT